MIPRPVEDEESAPENEAKKPLKRTPTQEADEAAEQPVEPATASESEPEAEAERDSVSDAAPAGEDVSGGSVSGEASGDTAEDAAADTTDRTAPADGPAFEVSDRRASIAADSDGVRFTLDDEAADFRWDEIGAVEIGIPRFGRRFTVTVHTITRRRYHVDVDAPARSGLKEWSAELDDVLDAYFEEA
ncbi:hypothetical protein [Streptomyces liangshanensis]|uniref:hypothetical protein n=1 Tax=Streptomyces liangshanensis TaxID=2717324 RepID=UPI0036DBE0DB